ncbi:MAG: hypothetical protein CM1200mP24_02770 [Gammaproteobacteria bacterium]|nr:MAG: hypothetical protein CM1200mP24_02770 [Gammaproteobacteria bacterium]
MVFVSIPNTSVSTSSVSPPRQGAALVTPLGAVFHIPGDASMRPLTNFWMIQTLYKPTVIEMGIFDNILTGKIRKGRDSGILE